MENKFIWCEDFNAHSALGTNINNKSRVINELITEITKVD